MSQLSQSLDECLSPMHWGVRYKSAYVSLIQTDGGAGDAMAFGVDFEKDNDMDGREETHARHSSGTGTAQTGLALAVTSSQPSGPDPNVPVANCSK